MGERSFEKGGPRKEAVLVATQRRCISEKCSLENSSFREELTTGREGVPQRREVVHRRPDRGKL